MEKRSLTIWVMVAVIFAVAGGSAGAVEYTHIWVDQGTGINHPDTPGTPNEPFKSITYALARADYLGWPEPWHVHIGPGVYDADPAKPAPEREIFPIQLRQDMIFEAGDVNDPNTNPNDPGSRIIDGQHLVEGFTSLLYGNDLTGIEIRGLTFRNIDHSTGNGGAIELIECGGLIENCVIEDCSAQSGGGLWLSPRSGAEVVFDFISCTFTGNSASNSSSDDARGGGFYVNGALTASITDCTFNTNSASGSSYIYGGGFFVNGTLTGNITNCTFTGNSVSAVYFSPCGGGFFVGGILDGNVTNCTFTGNSARDHGAGFWISSMTGNIQDCNFVENAAANGAGFAIVSLNNGIAHCNFTRNSAESSGGGFSVGTLNNDIIDCTFTANLSEGYGAGFYVSANLNGNISDCHFIKNEAEEWGSGFYTTNLTGDISDCSFTDNVGSTAGFHVNGTLTGDIRSSEFDNGEHMLGDVAVYLNGTFDGTMENCRFYDFTDNTLRLLSDSGTTARIRNCLFVVAPEAIDDVSGWVVRTSQKMIVSNNTIVGPGLDPNYSPSALYLDFDTQANNSEIFNNIIVGTEKAIVVDPAVDMPITYNQFYNVDEIVCLGEQCLGNDIWWLEWNLSNFRHNDYGDPCFVAGDSMYRIQGISPCVDEGDPNYVPEAGEKDIEGQPRMADGSIDRGADEHYTYTLVADFNRDGIVEWLDLGTLGTYWLQNEPSVDIYPPGGDGIVNFGDYAKLGLEWLETEWWYGY